MDATRYLVVIADDYGIGPETSRAILELATRGVLTGAVLLVNSPYAEDSVHAWRAAGMPLELGWHPCLTMDPPCAPAEKVPTLLGPDGCLLPLGTFLRNLHLGRIKADEVDLELRAQYRRFVELIGAPPTVVNSHQHTSLFGYVGPLLENILAQSPQPPYVRRVREPWRMLAGIKGARLKRTMLSVLGRRQGRRLDKAGYPGNDWLGGITDPQYVTDPDFFTRWISKIPGRVVEMACHPGYFDSTLIGRDCGPDDGLAQRRVDELARLIDPAFLDAVHAAGFAMIAPSALRRPPGGSAHAA